MEVDTNIEKLQKIKNSEINKALGFFILFFGLCDNYCNIFYNNLYWTNDKSHCR